MWKLGKVHKIGELIAAIAVVVSLLFVGIELQQNNRIQRQTATRNLVRDWTEAISAYKNPELACLSVRLLNDPTNLTQQEATQIEAVYWHIYKVYEQIHYQYEEGMIDESVWGGFSNNIRIEASYESYRVWWLSYQRTFSPRFRKFMSDTLAATPIDATPYYLNKDCDTAVGENYWIEYSAPLDTE